MWECGLKLCLCAVLCFLFPVVTPYVGVWIETLLHGAMYNDPAVTPYVGVWIETDTSG